MKCIHCGTDSKLKERLDQRCKSCRRQFAFEPRKDARRITDGAFQAAIMAVSGKGEHYFTERQLWYELNRRLLKKVFWRRPWGPIAGTSVVGGILTVGLSGGALIIPGVLLGIGGLALGAAMSRRAASSSPQRPVLEHGAYRLVYLDVWIATHGAPEKLVREEKTDHDESRSLPPDVTQYSFDRALVVEDSQTAAMLVANRFHFENNCAILSIDGFPFGKRRVLWTDGNSAPVRDTVMDMLRRNPQLKVFALHSASLAGCTMPGQLRDQAWFPDSGVQLIDLGLRPSHAQKMRMMSLEASPVQLPDAVRGALQPDEVRWLEEGNSAELAAVRPAKLMRAIYQGFARAGKIGSTDGVAGTDTGGGFFIWGYDGGADVYAADSFG
jgi:hypothetical protein